MANVLDANKQLVRDFYDLAFNQQQPAEAAARYVATPTGSTTPAPATALRPSSPS